MVHQVTFQLGALFDPSNLQPYIKHPVSGKPIHIFLDICHMLKLIRNTLASKGCLYDSDNNKIEWKFIEKLEKEQSKEGVLLANKLKKHHIDFSNQKMKTSLAAQTLSCSVAAGLSYMVNSKNLDFQGCEATINFITIINNLFDTFNSKSKYGFGFKGGLCAQNADKFFNYFAIAEQYLRGLKLSKENYEPSILKTQSKTGFLGFLIAIYNFKNLYEQYVSNGKLQYLLGFKFSQDHIETFFSAIRLRGGWNNNPNCIQFTAAYKKLLIQNEIKASKNGNCLEDEDSPTILTISSATLSENIEKKTLDYLNILENNNDIDDNELNLKDISSVIHDAVTYISGFVEKTLRDHIKCASCIAGLNALEIYQDQSLILCKDWGGKKGGLIKPRTDVVLLCQIAEKKISMFELDNKLKDPFFYDQLLQECFKESSSGVFSTLYTDPEHKLNCPYDKTYLKKYCFERYMKTKLRFIAAKVTLRQQEQKIRQKCNKLVLFKGQ